jgi:hypothetical protein
VRYCSACFISNFDTTDPLFSHLSLDWHGKLMVAERGSLMIRDGAGEVDGGRAWEVDGGWDTKPNGKYIIELLILFPISMQLIKYLLVSVSTGGGTW